MNYSETIQGLALRHFDLFGDVSFHPMTLNGITLFSRIKSYEIHINASIKIKVLGGISCHVMAALATSEGYTCLFVVSYALESK